MARFSVNKLVRDRIVDQQIVSGAKPVYRMLSQLEHTTELIKKIIEEAQEVTAAGPDSVAEEIADVQQALDDLKVSCGLTNADISRAQRAKLKKKGAFAKGIFIEFTELDEDHPWIGYYRQNPDRYPELPAD